MEFKFVSLTHLVVLVDHCGNCSICLTPATLTHLQNRPQRSRPHPNRPNRSAQNGEEDIGGKEGGAAAVAGLLDGDHVERGRAPNDAWGFDDMIFVVVVVVVDDIGMGGVVLKIGKVNYLGSLAQFFTILLCANIRTLSEPAGAGETLGSQTIPRWPGEPLYSPDKIIMEPMAAGVEKASRPWLKLCRGLSWGRRCCHWPCSLDRIIVEPTVDQVGKHHWP